MELLLFLAILVPIALVVMLGIMLSRTSELSRELRATRERMNDLSRMMVRQADHGVGLGEPFVSVASIVPPEPPNAGSEQAPTDEVAAPVASERAEEPMTELIPELSEEPVAISAWATPAPPGPPKAAHGPEEPQAPSPSFFDRHPDLEKFIGENLINKIGIAVLVIGVGLLMRYAVGQGLIGETGRTLIGLAAGGILVSLAHRVHANYRAFSSVLVAGGIAVFYFSIAIAFHQYRLIGQIPAFAIMVLITALAVTLTLAYDRRELAVIALLGGFATPFIASSGEGNFRVLFTYLLILNTGMLVLANFKKWHIIHILSFALTFLIFGGWALEGYPTLEPRPAFAAWGFATAFFLVFFSMNLLYNLRHRKAFGPLDHGLLLANTGAYYGVGLFILGQVVPKVTGLFTALLGLFYLGFAMYFHRRDGIPHNLKLLLIGLVLTFVSLAAPVQLEGSHITLFWAAETVLLFWFAQRTGLRLVERGSLAVLALMLVSLLMDLANSYGGFGADGMTPLLNKGWMTGMVCVLSLGAMTVLLSRSERSPLPGVPARLLRMSIAVLAIGLLYLVNFLEMRYQLGRALDYHAVNMALLAWTLFYLLALEVATRQIDRLVRRALAVLLVLAALLYITGGHSSSRTTLALMLLERGGRGFYVLHYTSFALLVLALVRVAQMARQLIGRGRPGWDTYLWAMCSFLVIVASQELDHVIVWASSLDGRTINEALANARRAGYPILWGVGSFLFMWYGMVQRMRMVRVIALVLFGITLLKLFLFDLGKLSEGGRVAAFIFLGALLLVISFMYQKLKTLLREDEPNDLALDTGVET